MVSLSAVGTPYDHRNSLVLVGEATNHFHTSPQRGFLMMRDSSYFCSTCWQKLDSLRGIMLELSPITLERRQLLLSLYQRIFDCPQALEWQSVKFALPERWPALHRQYC